MSQSPKVEYLTRTLPARVAGADGTAPLFCVPFAATVVSLAYIPAATITGDMPDTRTVSVINKTQAGIGSTILGSLAFITGVDAVAHDEKPLTLSATPADLVVAEGDVLALTSAHGGSTGLADPGGVIVVKLARTPTAE